MVSEEKKQELRARIEAGEARNANRSISDYAKDASETATEFVKEHPFVAIAGVAAVGLAIGAMTRPGRRLAGRAGSLATYASELGIAYASGLLDSAGAAARKGGESLEDWSEDVRHDARAARRAASHRLSDASDDIRHAGRKAARRAGRKLRDARTRIGA